MRKVRQVNAAGIALIKRFEGLVDGNTKTPNLDPYVDPIGILTIGWGHAITYGERFLRDNPADWKIARKLYPNGITRAQAERLLQHDVDEHSRDILHLFKRPLTDNQFAACASLAFNIGAPNFAKSSVLREINFGNYKLAADRFRLWNKAGGKVLQGLINRREAERKLFLTP